MNWLSQNRGHIVCALLGILVGALLVLWLKGSKPKTILPNPVADAPALVQPVFIHDTTVIVKRLGGSIGIATPTAPEATPPETVYQKPSPCKPFSLRLVSSPTSLSSVLDSVVVDYYYPSGMHSFEYYGAKQKREVRGQPDGQGLSLLSIGVTPSYRLRDSKIQIESYISLRLRRATVQFGYRVSEQQPSWFVSVGKEWRVF